MKFREEETLRYLGAKGAPDEQTSALLRDAAAQLDAIAAPRHAVLRVLYGSLTLERLALTHPGLEGSASVALSGRPVDCRTADGVLAFTEPVRIEAGEALEAVFAGI